MSDTTVPLVRENVSPPTVFVCPDCGKDFSRPQSVGVHRRIVHGVMGQASSSVSGRKRREQAKMEKRPRPVFVREAPPPKFTSTPKLRGPIAELQSEIRRELEKLLPTRENSLARHELLELYYALERFTG